VAVVDEPGSSRLLAKRRRERLHMGKVKYDGAEYDEPQVSVTKITPAGKVDGYVYPY